MATAIFENVGALYATALENYKKMTKTALDISEQLVAEHIELSEALLDTAQSKASKASNPKDFPAFVANQAELGQECLQQVLKSSQSCAEIVAEAGKFYQGLFESGVKTANSNFGATATKSKKKA